MVKRQNFASVLASLLILIPMAAHSATTTNPTHSAPTVQNQQPHPVSPHDQIELRRLLIQDCGSCHGLRMTGGLGPALTPDVLRSRTRSALITTILYGRPGTAMPPWGNLLNDAQAAWIVDLLLDGLTQP